MATPKLWYAKARIGGGANALDLIDGDSLSDLDIGIVLVDNVYFLYVLDADLAGSEVDPGIIVPDTNPGTKCWVLQKCFGEKVNAIGSIGGGAQAIDLNLGRAVSGTVDTSETTFTFSNPLATGYEDGFTLYLTNGGSQTVNWPASVDWAGGSAPSLTAAGVDILVFTTIDGGTIWHGMIASTDSK